jgi:toxin HigB-1
MNEGSDRLIGAFFLALHLLGESRYNQLVRFRFADSKLESLYRTGRGGRQFSKQIVDAFVRAVARIDAARDERDLYAQKGMRFEKLRGDRVGQRSVRLNQQWRLILSIEQDAHGNFVWIIEIVDYH